MPERRKNGKDRLIELITWRNLAVSVLLPVVGFFGWGFYSDTVKHTSDGHPARIEEKVTEIIKTVDSIANDVKSIKRDVDYMRGLLDASRTAAGLQREAYGPQPPNYYEGFAAGNGSEDPH